MARVLFNFFAQAANVDVDRSRGNEGSFFPHRVEQLVARQDAAAMGGQIFQQPEFTHRGEDIASPA